MSEIKLNQPAPDFEMSDFRGKTIRLSDFKGKMNVLLVFNRGFF
jgi:peroxiredoxin